MIARTVAFGGVLLLACTHVSCTATARSPEGHYATVSQNPAAAKKAEHAGLEALARIAKALAPGDTD